MYERINVRGMISGAILLVLALAQAFAAGSFLNTLRNPLLYLGVTVLAYNAIAPRLRGNSRSRQKDR